MHMFLGLFNAYGMGVLIHASAVTNLRPQYVSKIMISNYDVMNTYQGICSHWSRISFVTYIIKW